MVPCHINFVKNLPVYYSVSKDEVASKPHIFSNQPQKCDLIRSTFYQYCKDIMNYQCFKNTPLYNCAEKLNLNLFNEKKVADSLKSVFNLPKSNIYNYDVRFLEYAENIGYSLYDFPPKTTFFTGCFGLKFNDD